jgi:acyl carrier protein
MKREIEERVRSIIAETFDVSESNITNETVRFDIDGWDSLSHTILMVRLQRHFGINIPEEVAGNVQNVGELTEAIRRLVRGVAI